MQPDPDAARRSRPGAERNAMMAAPGADAGHGPPLASQRLEDAPPSYDTLLGEPIEERSPAGFALHPTGLLRPPRLADPLAALLLLSLASAAALAPPVPPEEGARVMLYLGAVLTASVWRGIWAGALAALGGFGLLNFLFAEPRFTLHVARPQDLVTLAGFLLTALITGLLAGGLRQQRDMARAQTALLTRISSASTALHLAQTPPEVLTALLEHLAALTGGRAMMLAAPTAAAAGPVPAILASQPPGLQPSGADLEAAALALHHDLPEAASAPGWAGSAYSFLPLGRGPQGKGAAYVIGYERAPAPAPGQDEREAAAAILVRQADLALRRLAERARAEAEARRATAEELRAGLLASLSHDLRTPLATILGGVTTLNDLKGALPPEAARDILGDVEQEARRLAEYVDNLLHLTRLQAGARPRLTWVDVGDATEAAALRLRRVWPEADLALQLPELPMIRAEPALIEQALYNLMDNALRHGTAPVRLGAEVTTERHSGTEGTQLRIWVDDAGPRQPGRLWAVTGSGDGGGGLGLRITHAISRAFGATLYREAATPTGTRIGLIFPLNGKAEGTPMEAPDHADDRPPVLDAPPQRTRDA